MHDPEMRSPAKAATKARANSQIEVINTFDDTKPAADDQQESETALAAAMRAALARKAVQS
jgi:hypothetical protein